MIYAKILDVKISEDMKGVAGEVEGDVIKSVEQASSPRV
jgi:hypothetical protein